MKLKGFEAMNKNEFMELVKDKVLDVLREKDSTLNAIIEKVTKSNGVLYCGLSFRGKDTVQPVIYLDDFYKRFEAGVNIDDIVNQVVEIYVTNRINDIDIGSITDFEAVKDRIVVAIYNTEANVEKLSNIPHKDYKDLSVYYRVDVPINEKEGMGSMIVNDHIMKLWNLSTNEINEIAWKNTKRMYPAKLLSMFEILQELCGGEIDEMQDYLAKPTMYVLSNVNKLNGAVYIADSDALAMVADELEDDYVVLPSSRHEVIIVPLSQISDDDYTYLKDMVYEINRKEVDIEDVLSDNIYIYKRADRELRLIA